VCVCVCVSQDNQQYCLLNDIILVVQCV